MSDMRKSICPWCDQPFPHGVMMGFRTACPCGYMRFTGGTTIYGVEGYMVPLPERITVEAEAGIVRSCLVPLHHGPICECGWCFESPEELSGEARP